jgi:hypothetical protein
MNPVKTPETVQRKPDIDTSMYALDSSCPPRFMFDPTAVAPEETGEAEMNFDEGMSVASDDLGEDFDDDTSSHGTMDTDEGLGKGTGKRLPKGTSDYQADWLVDSDSEKEDKEIIGSDEELESEDDKESDEDEGEESNEEGEDEMDWIEEQKQLKLTKGTVSVVAYLFPYS